MSSKKQIQEIIDRKKKEIESNKTKIISIKGISFNEKVRKQELRIKNEEIKLDIIKRREEKKNSKK